MSRYSYERLSAESTALLKLESPTALAHAAATYIFDAGPLATESGGIDVEAIRRAIESRLHLVPHYRQTLRWIPFERHPVWVDDASFNLDFHVRHSSLPRPGTVDQLKKTSARINAQRLDRSRPLWECWILEGLSGGRFGLLLKSHLCMLDQPAGSDLMAVLLSPDRYEAFPDGPPYIPRPNPSARELVVDEVIRRARLPRQALERMRALSGDCAGLRHSAGARARVLAEQLGYTVRGALETPINGPIGPHRRVDYLNLPLKDARDIRRALNCTLHDVVLATVTGAVHRFLQERLVNPAVLDFRIATPVLVSAGEAEGEQEDEIREWILDLPIALKDPLKRIEAIQEQTRALAESDQAIDARSLFGVEEWSGSRMLARAAASFAPHAPVNLTVTNVPAPQIPMYLLGARLEEGYGHVPLRNNQGLGVTIFSYDGKLCWGFNGDFDQLPDLPRFTAAVEASFRELGQVAARGRPTLELVESDPETAPSEHSGHA